MFPLKTLSAFVSLLFLCHNATANEASDEKPPDEVVTITQMQQGDVACYLTFKDAQQKTRSAEADFSICNTPNLLHQKSTVTFRKVQILAGRCEGDPDCPHRETVWLVGSATPLPPQDLCQKGEVLYHGCRTAKGNLISFCTTKKVKGNGAKTPGDLVLRHGTLKKVTMEVRSTPKAPIESRLARYAGANTRLVCVGSTKGTPIFFESAYIDEHRIHGMSRYGKKPHVGLETCHDHRPGHQRFTEPHEWEDF